MRRITVVMSVFLFLGLSFCTQKTVSNKGAAASSGAVNAAASTSSTSVAAAVSTVSTVSSLTQSYVDTSYLTDTSTQTFMSIANYQICLGQQRSTDLSGTLSWCFPNSMPSACPTSSWQLLQNDPISQTLCGANQLVCCDTPPVSPATTDTFSWQTLGNCTSTGITTGTGTATHTATTIHIAPSSSSCPVLQ